MSRTAPGMIRCGPAVAALGALLTLAASPAMAEPPAMRVCPAEAFDPARCEHPSLNAALAAAGPGQVIQVAAGTYRQGVKIAVPGVSIVGAPGARFLDRVYNGKGIFTVTAPGVTIEGLGFSGARAPDGNGAAIRLETDRVTIRGNEFENNQMHILGGTAGAEGLIVIEHNRMIRTAPSDNFNHGVYISKKVEGTLIFRGNSLIATGGLGHGLKTGAGQNLIENNLIAQLDADGSLCIDIVIGGHSEIRGNICQSGPNRDNRNLMAVALSRQRADYPKRFADLTIIEDNLFIVDGGARNSTCLLLSGSPGPLQIRNNTLVGIAGGCRVFGDPLGARLAYGAWHPIEAAEGANRLLSDRAAAGLPAYPELPAL